MEIDVTEFVKNENSMLYSGSIANLGPKAAEITWNNASEVGKKYIFVTEENKKQFADYFVGIGMEPDIIEEATIEELNTLFIQLVASNVNEADCTSILLTNLIETPDGHIYFILE